MNVAIIPARGGSKRILKQNIKEFLGSPIISYPIKAAMKTKLFERIIVSTDDNEIADMSESLGAEVPYLRSKNISDDFSTVSDVMADTVDWLNQNDQIYENICCIFPTTPCITDDDIVSGYKKLSEGNWKFVFGASKSNPAYYRSFKTTSKNAVKMIFPEFISERTQDLPIVYHDAGQFYWGKNDAWLDKKKVFDLHSTIIELPNWKARDLDTLEDWHSLEELIRASNNN